MRKVGLGLVVLALAIGVVGCKKDEKKNEPTTGSGPAAAEPAGGSPAAGDAAKPLIGAWTIEGSGIEQILNSKGRVKFVLGPNQQCLGNWSVDGTTFTVTYDDGQTGCVNGSMPFALKDDGNSLDFLGTVYKRVNATDDTSF